MTLEEAKDILQKISERMDEAIESRRSVLRINGSCVSENVAKDDVWNLAHDVLEIIHCPEKNLADIIGEIADERIDSRLGEVHVKVVVDTSELDAAIEKVKQYNELAEVDPAELDGLSRGDTVLLLVGRYGWDYSNAAEYVTHFW